MTLVPLRACLKRIWRRKKRKKKGKKKKAEWKKKKKKKKKKGRISGSRPSMQSYSLNYFRLYRQKLMQRRPHFLSTQNIWEVNPPGELAASAAGPQVWKHPPGQDPSDGLGVKIQPLTRLKYVVNRLYKWLFLNIYILFFNTEFNRLYKSPWYNRNGWLSVRHQVTYLLSTNYTNDTVLPSPTDHANDTILPSANSALPCI